MTQVFAWLEGWPAGAKILVDVLASLATALAAVLAAITILQAKRQARAAQLGLVHERQVEFQLDLLKELAALNTRASNVAMASAEFRARAAMLSVGLVPLAREAVGLPSTDSAKATINGLRQSGITARDSAQAEIAAEIETAIATVLSSRRP